ncbi:MAG: cytidine deaminase [Bacteroidales bacterium]
MVSKSIFIQYDEFHSLADLSEQDKVLLEKAVEASGRAYSPYSRFKVGAAVLLGNGEIISGSNQENAAYPSGLCAERVALFSAVSQYPGTKILTLALVARAEYFHTGKAVTPCGACRQVMAEYESIQQTPIRMIFSGMDGSGIIVEGVDALLPFKFSKSDLNIDL